MKSTRIPAALSLVALAWSIAPTAHAQDPRWYLGASIGKSKADIDGARITGNVLGVGVTAPSITDDEHGNAYKLFGGYQFNRFFALEAGFFDLGTFDISATTVPAGTVSGDIKIRGLNVDAVGTFPFTEKFAALGRVGVIHAETRNSFSGTGAANVHDPDPNKKDTNLKVGMGLQYHFTESFGMRAEAERYWVRDAVGSGNGDIDVVSVGLIYRFGRNTWTRTSRATPTPAPAVAPPPPPPTVIEVPVMVVVPVPARTQEYCTILDIQFEVNQEEIQREEKEKLAVVGTFMTKYPDTTAQIEGHTDNVGTSEHNLQLSQNRAQSVVSYMVNDLQIAQSRLTAVGYGDTRPLGDNRTEEGKRSNRRIDAVIACATDIEGLTVAPARITMAMLIEFDQNKADIKPQYDGDLRKVAEFLKANPSVTATVEGHSGNLQGTPALVLEISQRRAQNVVNYLVDHFAIERSRLSAEGFGRTRRFAYNTSVEGQQENRRVNIIINYPKS